MADWYRVLQVSRKATEGEIKSAYRKMAKKYHPDAHPGDKECEARFKEITEAYTILSDAKKRRKYDEELDGQPVGGTSRNPKKKPAADPGSAKVDFENISRSFESFFGFDPKTKEVVNEKKLKPDYKMGNPLDTTKIFEAFMVNGKR